MILFTLKTNTTRKVGLQVAIRPQDIQEITEHHDSDYSYVRYTLFDSPQSILVVGKVYNLMEEVNMHMNMSVGESV